MVTSVFARTVTYLTDTEPGSSGSPVFNSAWEVVALHAGAVTAVDPRTGDDIYENEGINVNCILDDWSHINALSMVLEEVARA
jgi:V8-like Glu-specific endopeptidase